LGSAQEKIIGALLEKERELVVYSTESRKVFPLSMEKTLGKEPRGWGKEDSKEIWKKSP